MVSSTAVCCSGGVRASSTAKFFFLASGVSGFRMSLRCRSNSCQAGRLSQIGKGVMGVISVSVSVSVSGPLQQRFWDVAMSLHASLFFRDLRDLWVDPSLKNCNLSHDFGCHFLLINPTSNNRIFTSSAARGSSPRPRQMIRSRLPPFNGRSRTPSHFRQSNTTKCR